MTGRRRRALALVVTAAAAAVYLAGLGLVGLGSDGDPVARYPFWRETAVNTLPYLTLGMLLTLRRPDHRVGWLFAVVAFVTAAQLCAGQYGMSTVAPGWSLPGAASAAWLSSLMQMSAVLLIILLLLVFPTGRLPSERWRPVVWSWAAAATLSLVDTALRPRPLEDFPGLSNPYGVASGIYDVLAPLNVVFSATALIGGIASLFVRLRRARGEERQQVKWFVWAAAVGVAALVVGPAFPILNTEATGSLLWTVVPTSLPLAAGLAVLRYRLYDIDRIINRTLVYAVLTALLVAVYLATVTLLQGVLSPLAGRSQLAVAMSTLAVAALFSPLRRRVQAGVDRRFNRDRYDAARTLAGYRDRLRDELDLDTVAAELVGAVRTTVQPTSATLWLRASGEQR